MPRRTKTDGSLRAKHHSELRRLDKAGGRDHSVGLVMDAARRHSEKRSGYSACKRSMNHTRGGKTALFWPAGEESPCAVELLVKAGRKATPKWRIIGKAPYL